MDYDFVVIDPGGTTGFAHFIGGKPFQTLQVQLSLIEMFNFLASIRARGIEHIVCEDFLIRPEHSANQWGKGWTLRLIGVIEVSCALYGMKLHMQTPASAFQFIKSAKAEGPHAASAVSHGLLYAYKEGGCSARDCNDIARQGLRVTLQPGDVRAGTLIAAREDSRRFSNRTIAPRLD